MPHTQLGHLSEGLAQHQPAERVTDQSDLDVGRGEPAEARDHPGHDAMVAT